MVRATVENVSLAPKAPDEKKDEAQAAQKGVPYNQLTVGVVKESTPGEQRYEKEAHARHRFTSGDSRFVGVGGGVR